MFGIGRLRRSHEQLLRTVTDLQQKVEALQAEIAQFKRGIQLTDKSAEDQVYHWDQQHTEEDEIPF